MWWMEDRLAGTDGFHMCFVSNLNLMYASAGQKNLLPCNRCNLVGYKCREKKIYKLLKKHTQNKYLRKKNGTKTFKSAL